MSAWIVSKQHIDVLVRGVLEQGGFFHRGKWVEVVPDDWQPIEGREPKTQPMNASQLGKMLWSENHKSIHYRYASNERTPVYVYREPKNFLVTKRTWGKLTYESPQTRIDPAVLSMQVHCYDYQTCEHPQYVASKAHSVVLYLGYAVSQYVEGYDDAKWGV